MQLEITSSVVVGTAPPSSSNANSIDKALWAKDIPSVTRVFSFYFSSLFLFCRYYSCCHATFCFSQPLFGLFHLTSPSLLFLPTQAKFKSRTVQTLGRFLSLSLRLSPPIPHCCQWPAKNRATHQAGIIPNSVCIHTFSLSLHLFSPKFTDFNWLFSPAQLWLKCVHSFTVCHKAPKWHSLELKTYQYLSRLAL